MPGSAAWRRGERRPREGPSPHFRRHLGCAHPTQSDARFTANSEPARRCGWPRGRWPRPRTGPPTTSSCSVPSKRARPAPEPPLEVGERGGEGGRARRRHGPSPQLWHGQVSTGSLAASRAVGPPCLDLRVVTGPDVRRRWLPRARTPAATSRWRPCGRSWPPSGTRATSPCASSPSASTASTSTTCGCPPASVHRRAGTASQPALRDALRAGRRRHRGVPPDPGPAARRATSATASGSSPASSRSTGPAATCPAGAPCTRRPC